jgi:DNA primase
MKEKQLLNFLERLFKEKAKLTRGGDEAMFHCPSCLHRKQKLSVNLISQRFQCWVCEFRGNTVFSILKKLNPLPLFFEEYKTINKEYGFSSNYEKNHVPESLSLPDGFFELYKSKSPTKQSALSYLYSRGLTDQDILKYNIGYCITGSCENMVVIPSYDEKQQLNFYVGRSYDPNSYKKHSLSPSSKDIIGFELFVNWDLPVVVCEGVFDAITIRNNAIPLFGKKIPKALIKKIIENNVQDVYIALDNDALKEALSHAETLINFGKTVYLMELDGKDPNEIGHDHFIEILYNTPALTFQKLMEKKVLLK